MGLLRKTLSVGTVGLVSGSSKKQKVAKATMKSSAAGARASEQAAAAAAQTNAALNMAARLAIEKANREEQFRYDTDPVYRECVDGQREIKRLAMESAAAARVLEDRRLADLGEAARQLKACKKAKRLPGSRPLGPPPSGQHWAFNPPPNWPAAPEGWAPHETWQPDASWGPPSATWLVWKAEPLALA